MITSYLILGLALIGLMITLHIYRKKHSREPITCLIGDHCEVVLRSKYSRLFGFENEFLGALYYIGLTVVYVLFLSGISVPHIIQLGAEVAIVMATLLSIYLVMIQSVTLKKYCFWCLTSAGVNLGIFFLTLSTAM